MLNVMESLIYVFHKFCKCTPVWLANLGTIYVFRIGMLLHLAKHMTSPNIYPGYV